MRTDYAYQDAIRRDFRNKVTAVIAVGLLGLVLTGAVEDGLFVINGDGGSVNTHTGVSTVNVPVSENALATR